MKDDNGRKGDLKISVFLKRIRKLNAAVAVSLCTLALVVALWAVWMSVQMHLKTLLFALVVIGGIFLLLTTLCIREQRKAKRLEAFLAMMTQTTGGCYWETNPATKKLRLTPRGLSLFGRDVHTMDEFAALIHPDDANRFQRAERKALLSGEKLDAEFRIQSAGGNWRWFVMRGSVAGRAADGTPDRVLGSMMDIDDYRRAVEAMQASEKRLATIFRSAPGSMAVTDEEGRLLDANQAFYDMLGFSAEELQGVPILSLSDTPRDKENRMVMAEILRECESYEDRRFHLEENFVRRDGRRITLEFGLSAILDYDGNVQNYIFSGIDITRQRADQAELDLHTQRLQQLHSLIHTLLRTRNRDHLLEGMLGYLKSVVPDSSCAVYLFAGEKADGEATLSRLAWYDEENIPVPDSGPVLTAIAHEAPWTEYGEGELEVRRISPIIFQTHNVGAVDLCKPSGLLPSELKMYQLLIDYVAGFWVLYDLMALREEEASVDPLTGIWNRRYMIRRLQEESDRISRYGGNACIVIGDMGNFKHTNDNYGHVKGDEVLVKSAAAIRKTLRFSDSVGRYGGDEFIMLLPNVTKADASMVVDRIRQELSQIQIRSDDSTPDSPLISVVMDFGLALFPGGAATLMDTINLADEAMYANKVARKEQAAAEERDAAGAAKQREERKKANHTKTRDGRGAKEDEKNT